MEIIVLLEITSQSLPLPLGRTKLARLPCFERSPVKEVSQSIAIFNNPLCQEVLLSNLNNTCICQSLRVVFFFPSVNMNRSYSLCVSPFHSIWNFNFTTVKFTNHPLIHNNIFQHFSSSLSLPNDYTAVLCSFCVWIQKMSWISSGRLTMLGAGSGYSRDTTLCTPLSVQRCASCWKNAHHSDI